jgi:glutamine synthetase
VQVGLGEVSEVVLALPDLAGRLVGQRVSARHFLDSVVRDGFGVCTYLLTTDVDMAVVAPVADLDPEGTGSGDMVLVPDLVTLRPLSWDPGTVHVLTDARLPDGRRCGSRRARSPEPGGGAGGAWAHALHRGGAGVPRVHRVLRRGGGRGLVGAHAGDPDRRGLRARRARARRALARRLRREMARPGWCSSRRAGSAPRVSTRSSSRTTRPSAPQTTRRSTRRAPSRSPRRRAPRWRPPAKYDEAEGSSCHLHVSLRGPGGEPVLAGDGEPDRFDLAGTSPVLWAVLAGQLACLRELTLLFALTVNSYKRLRPGAFAPTAVAWGRDNRLTALRLVGSGPSLRLGAPGARRGRRPLPRARRGAARRRARPRARAAPARGRTRRPAAGTPGLPTSLAEGADVFEASEVARKGLGDDVVPSRAPPCCRLGSEPARPSQNSTPT